jgi:hypothetical protein
MAKFEPFVGAGFNAGLFRQNVEDISEFGVWSRVGTTKEAVYFRARPRARGTHSERAD